MPAPTNIQSELLRHREADNAKLQELRDQGNCNTEQTRTIFLRFVADDRQDAVGLSQLLFAKGMRLITPEPKETAQGWRVEVAVKHNLREITVEDFTCDLITLASGVRALYDCWDFLSEQPAEQTQEHTAVRETQGS